MLTPMEIGDLLDLEKEATYPCSDGSITSCISVDALVDAAFEKGQEDERERIQKMYEDMGCVPEEDNCWYSFWQSLKE